MFFHNMGGMGGMGRGQDGPVDTRLYDILKVKPDASEEDIKKSYRKLAKEFHPDKNPDHGDQFKEISFAYEILSNPERRRLYDMRGLDGIKEGGGSGGGFGGDLFSHIFGDEDDSPFSSFFGMGGGGRRRARRKFQDTVYPLNVTLEEVYNGKTAKLRLSKKALCTKCKGSGGKTGQSYECHSCRGRGVKNVVQQIGPGMIQQMQVRCPDCRGEGSRIPDVDKCSNCKGEKSEEVKKILEVHVEPGMRHNDKVTFPREGDQSDPEIEPGDVVIVIQVKPHDVFEREGDDLIAKKTISLNEALCGYEIPLKHLDGRTLILKNKPGDIITPDCIRGIVGEGMPQRRHHDIRGNLYVKFDVAFPNDHFIEDEAKYKIIESAFPPVRKITHPPNCEEVSLMEYDEKRYRGGRGGQAYEEDGSDEEMGGHGHHGPQVQCAQS
ncbi:hypothetical protein Y032_0608g593 [Ancylostoma ceylanicum]|uniref:DnaJ domain protein n=2 Tax=Ancylostoma ceylanicum TaxID=53326 RepID=A0A016WMN5_9BILA|nr:hypothetical protein Y032_0608g593 [Ancylostoma ceylanicum]